MEFAEFLTSLPMISIILFIVGIILLVVELSIPGFGVAGGTSILCLAFAIILAAKTLTQGLWLAVIAAIVVVLSIILFFVLLTRGRMSKKLVLNQENTTVQGFQGSSDLSALTGRHGTASTILRPAGRAEIDGAVYDVLSSGDYIQPKSEIVVVSVEGNRITVSAVKKAKV